MSRNRDRETRGIAGLVRRARERQSPLRVIRHRNRPLLEPLEDRQLLATFSVTNTQDSGAGSLRQAILNANLDAIQDNIEFSIPASTAPYLNVPVPGFDPVTQTWTIQLLSPLPTLSSPVWIDGYSEARVGMPYRYPSAMTSATQTVSVVGSPTGGTFTLQTAAPLPAGVTAAIPYNATPATIQAALEGIPGFGAGNIAVTGDGSVGTWTIFFQGAYAGMSIPNLAASASLTGGTNPGVAVQTNTDGGIPSKDPVYFRSVPNTLDAKTGNNARMRVIVDGSLTGGATGFTIAASHSTLRGLIISGFGVGVSVSATDAGGSPVVGTLIQGNSIGDFFLYPVDAMTGSPLPAPNSVAFTSLAGNSEQGVVLFSSNATVGGSNPQENNIICGNGQQGVLIQPGASGNQVLGNQIGMAGPSDNGLYSQDGNGAEGVLILSAGSLANPLTIQYASSNFVGSAAGGNVISGNAGAGVRLVGVGANRNLIQGNLIGVAPGGDYSFGTGNPGNGGDGVRIEDGTQNIIGGATAEMANAIASNQGAGIYLTGSNATGNLIANNMIGLTASGTQVLGNAQDGVAVHASDNTIGPGNTISQNLRGIGIYGPEGTRTLIVDNFIGTDVSGRQGFGNAMEGVRLDNSPANTIQGNASGSQVISGNQVGVGLIGISATGNRVAGNLIGTDRSGQLDLGNKAEGVLLSGAGGNTIGGSLASAQNLISANHWGVRLDGLGASGNVVQRNSIGPDISGSVRLGNEVYGVILSNSANNNTIGGASADLANRIVYQVSSGILAESGTGNSFLSNNLFGNGRLGIDLVALGDPPSGVTPNQPGARTGPNNLQNYPVLTAVTSNGTLTHVVGGLNSIAATSYLIQFFTSASADATGYGQGMTLLGSTQVTTDGSGNAAIDLFLAVSFPAGSVFTATATNLSTGDTSEFSQAVPESAAMYFSASLVSALESSNSATVTVSRTLSTGNSSVQFATVAGGTATAGTDYTATSGTLVFGPGESSKTFTISLLQTSTIGGVRTVNLALSIPIGGVVDYQSTAVLRIIDDDLGSSRVFLVTNTHDSGDGSLRQAILDANARLGPDDIEFAIPASTDPNLNVPVDGFDPVTQTWRITLLSGLPAITDQVTLDGYTQGHFPIPYRYPNAFTSIQTIQITGTPTGGSFTLSTQSPLPVLTTAELPYNATASDLGLELVNILGMQNVTVTGGPANVAPFTVALIGDLQGTTPPLLVASNHLSGGVNPGINITASARLGDPKSITSTPNQVAARDGNNAHIAVIIDGSQIPGGAPGFILDTTDSRLSGLIIDGFTIGVSVPNPQNIGNLIQGNMIGAYFLYPVKPADGSPLAAPFNVIFGGIGNAQQGIAISGVNTTIGGTNPQENNVIGNSGLQGILIDSAAHGNVVAGNQIGVIGPSDNGRYAIVGNGREGVLVYGSSNAIGGPGGGSGNLISGNQLSGVRIVGAAATRNIVAANIIGLAPGGGYLFGTGNPGNAGNGVSIEDSAQNQIGGSEALWGNVIASNSAAGVAISGLTSILNSLSNNLIGLTSDGKAVKGNAGDGVLILSPQAVVGPGNVIAGNLRGVHISGPASAGAVVRDNLIGTDITGAFDLGNALEGVLIENSTDAVIQGDARGSQVISGNHQGIVITGSSSTRNLIVGNLIGSDSSGLHSIPNALEGILVQGAPGNTIGGTATASKNLISANHWGVRLDGAATVNTLVQGNLIGPDITGQARLGDEVNGLILSNGASNNTIGGTAAGAGNVIAYNVLAGVSVESGAGNSILSNSIFSNGRLGIDLVAPGDPPSGVTPNQPGIRTGPNNLQNYPVLTTALGGGPISGIQGNLNSLPNTTFTIQFYTNLVPDSSGSGQGQTLIGSMNVTTDANGNAPLKYSPLNSLPSNVWITATATNTFTGDTSEFSNAVSAIPVSVQFATAATAVDATDGSVLIHVVRVGNPNAVVSVNYATSDGTGIAGQDYTTAAGTLTFQPGETDKTFPVAILTNLDQAASAVTVNLALSQPTGGATLGAIGTSVLTINQNMPPVLQFSAGSYTAYATANSAVVTVVRGGGSRGTTVQVAFATAGGSAAAGTDYSPVSGTLTLLPNQTSATFRIPILHPGSGPGSRTVGLVLSNPSGGAQLGTTSSATLTIQNNGSGGGGGGGGGNPSGPVDTVPPRIVGQRLQVGAGGITAILFTFSKPMDPQRAVDLGNYGYYALTAGRDGTFGTSDDGHVALSQVRYDASTYTVTVVPSRPLPTNQFSRITLDALANPVLRRGIADTSGNLLSASGNGVPGGAYVTTFGVGRRLTYRDGPGKTVSLSLSGGGSIQLFRAASGNVQTVRLVGAPPRRSVLTFRANNAGGRTTYLPPIQGSAGVRFRFRSPKSVFRPTPVPR